MYIEIDRERERLERKRESGGSKRKGSKAGGGRMNE